MSEGFSFRNIIPPRTSSNNLKDGPSKSPKPLSERNWLSTSRPASSLLSGVKQSSHQRSDSQPPLTLPPRHSSKHQKHKSQPLQTTSSKTNPYPVPMSPPPEDPLKHVGKELTQGKKPSWSADKESILWGPFDYLDTHPGKDIRTQLIHAFNAWLKVPEDSLKIITKVVGMLHTASLLVDDVEDSSILRRGVPVAHSIFGTAQTINSANYVYFCALRQLRKLKSPKAIDIYTEELLNLHRGQGMDLFWRDTLTCPSEDDYLEMVGNKTGGLFRLAVKMMQAESSVDMDCVPLVNTIGLHFQILDDYHNLRSPTYSANKGMCEDLTEGKFSFPVIHAIRADPSNLVLINILKQKTRDEEVKHYAVAYMERRGSFAYTRGVLKELEQGALKEIERVDAGRKEGTEIRKIVEKMRVDQ